MRAEDGITIVRKSSKAEIIYNRILSYTKHLNKADTILCGNKVNPHCNEYVLRKLYDIDINEFRGRSLDPVEWHTLYYNLQNNTIHIHTVAIKLI